MGFAGGAIGFQRFFIDGAFSDLIDDRFLKQLNERAFGKLAALPDDTHLGWIGPTHLFESELLAERVAYGRFAWLQLRVDTTKIPAQVVKAYQQVEQEVARQASGREFLSKGELRAAKQAGAERAEQEARGGAFRRMSSYPLLIDLEGKTVYLSTASTTIGDHLIRLFSDTFGRGLEPGDPARVALRLLTPGGKARPLENLQPAQFVRPPDEQREAQVEIPSGELSFLGHEFLTWLWHHVDAADEPLTVHGGDTLAVALEKTLKLKCVFGLTGVAALTAEQPAGLPEARAAVRLGKQPVRAGLVIGTPGGEYRLTLDALRLTVAGLQLPDGNEPQDDPRARLEERFERITEAADVIDALYEAFLQVRIGREWGAIARRIGEWAAGKNPESLKLVTAAGA